MNLRNVKIEGMATGTIDFTGAPLYGDRTGHSIVLKRVRRAADGTADTRVLCSRTAGDTKPSR
ncbi:ABC-type branched-subunit amino acid transport system substrate-binding protein OS=Streptomyces violarus OX=67380 GN=FHS41_001713 PE=4 SV=1 [Streptomyces violarus]